MKGCRPLTDDEVADVEQSFGGRYAVRDRALFQLGVLSGFRISELLSLRVGDVVQAGRIVDQIAVQRRNMKKKVEGRTVILHPKAKAALASWLEELQADGYFLADDFIFRSRKGQNRPISRGQAFKILQDAFEANELTGRLGTHSMRKTFANRVYRHLCQRRATGEPLDPFRLTSKALGHRNINSTDSYLSFLEDDIQQAILAI